MAKTGRPAVMDEKKKSDFIGLLRGGLKFVDACLAINISHETAYKNMRIDERFAELVKSARTQGKALLLGRIIEASKGTWTAAAWMLERMYPQEFAKRDPNALTLDQAKGLIQQLSAVVKRFVPPERQGEYAEAVRGVLEEAKKESGES